MTYMAVGSRQILFSDSPAPATAGNDVRQVSNLSDNQDKPVTENRPPERESSPEPEKGNQIDTRA